jgi:hypothetical protein
MVPLKTTYYKFNTPKMLRIRLSQLFYAHDALFINRILYDRMTTCTVRFRNNANLIEIYNFLEDTTYLNYFGTS